MLSNDASSYMQLALEDAARGLYTTTPNPRVGCVLVKAGQVIGRGWTQPAGQNHAEIQAILQARAQGHDPRNATAYVTLEPCSHIGRTAACAQALIDAGIVAVVAAMEDPNPLVRGRGFEMLRRAGLFVHCGLLEASARELNLGFINRMTQQRPWVRLKIAASLDGKTALPDGKSQWITSSLSRADGHAWRARACAVLTGIGTVLQDDPQLTAREVITPRQPKKILIDSSLDIPLNARLLHKAVHCDQSIQIICASTALLHTPKAQALHQMGVELIAFEHHAQAQENTASNDKTCHEWVRFEEREKVSQPIFMNRVDSLSSRIPLPSLLRLLASQGVNELHVEAGARLNGAFWQAQCVDELLLYIAPTLLCEGIGLLNCPSLPTLPTAPHVFFQSATTLGPDLRIIARTRSP